MKSWLLIVIGLQIGIGFARAGTSDVYQTTALFQGVIQTGTAVLPAISKVQVNTADLINFALGRPLRTPVDRADVLAIASDCANDQLRVIVYNTDSGENRVTIGNVTTILSLEGFQKRKYTRNLIGNLSILPTGDGTNGLTGGDLRLSATSAATTNGCLTSLKGNLLGTLGTVFPLVITNYPCTNFISCSLTNAEFCITNCVPDGTFVVSNTVVTYDIAVSRATLQTEGKRLGVLIENQ